MLLCWLQTARLLAARVLLCSVAGTAQAAARLLAAGTAPLAGSVRLMAARLLAAGTDAAAVCWLAGTARLLGCWLFDCYCAAAG